MAYSDYGAFVWLNGERRKDKEDVATFEESLDHDDWLSHCHHGILGDGDIRVMCHKQGLPSIYEATEAGFIQIPYCKQDTDWYNYDPINFEYKGHKFYFQSGNPYYARMITPNGDRWECEYDYAYGAGFEKEGEEKGLLTEDQISEVDEYKQEIEDLMEDIKKERAIAFDLLSKVEIYDKVIKDIKAEIKEWYWQADKKALAKDPCVVDAMVDLFIRTIDKHLYLANIKGDNNG